MFVCLLGASCYHTGLILLRGRAPAAGRAWGVHPQGRWWALCLQPTGGPFNMPRHNVPHHVPDSVSALCTQTAEFLAVAELGGSRLGGRDRDQVWLLELLFGPCLPWGRGRSSVPP